MIASAKKIVSGEWLVMSGQWFGRYSWSLGLCSLSLVLGLWSFVQGGPLDEMSVERWAKLREAERYQLNIAEKYYREQQWKSAGTEYEKFLTLYEKSEGASYAQLKWSNCQVNLRRQNTAIKDGYKSVIDYWPDSPEAVIASYLIGKTSKDMGETKQAKKAYGDVIAKHPKHLAAVLSRVDLAEMALAEKDTERCVTLWKELTYDVDRKGDAASPCINASIYLARHHFMVGDFNEGQKALATSYKDNLPLYLRDGNYGQLLTILSNLTHPDKIKLDEKIKPLGPKLADGAVAYLRTQIPTDIKEEAKKTLARQNWIYVAEVYQAARQPDKQKEVYEQMLKVFSGEDQVLGLLGQWYKENNKYDDARKTYGQYKDAVEGQNQVALSYRQERKYDQAVDIYRKLSVQDKREKSASWLSTAAQTYREAGKPDLALAIYRDLIATDPKNGPSYQWEVAMTLYYANRWKEAIVAYRGTERFPENYQHMATCNRQLKQYDEAILLYRQIIAAKQEWGSWGLLQIAYTQEEAGRKEPAIKTFQQVCERFPKTGEASTAHVHLNNKYKINVTLGGAKDD